jgi:hypothetical protein
MARLKKLAD